MMSSTTHQAQTNPSTSSTVSSSTTISMDNSSVPSSSSSASMSSSSTSSMTSSMSQTASSAAAKAKMLASSAYDSLKKGASVAADVTSQNIAKLQGRPTSMLCSNKQCAKNLAIPNSVWTWRCTQGHDNGHGSNECATCHETKLNALGNTISWPALLCQNCGTVTAVPHSELENSIYNSAYLLRHSFLELAEPPKTFHCGNCNTLLLVPMGPWVCQTCTTQNYAGAITCTKCSQAKNAQKVICGQCRKSTGIPSSGLMDNISSAIKHLTSSTTKAFLDVTGQQNVGCPICKHPIKIPSTFTPIPVQPAGAAGIDVPMLSEESKMQQPLSAATGEGLGHTLASQSWSLTLNCENCHNSFQLLKQQRRQGAATTTTTSTTTSNTNINSTGIANMDGSSVGSAAPSVDPTMSSSEEQQLGALRHSVVTPEGQQVAAMAPRQVADSHLYTAANAPASITSNTVKMPASSTTSGTAPHTA